MHQFYERLIAFRNKSRMKTRNNNNNNKKNKEEMASRNPKMTLEGLVEDWAPHFDAHLETAPPYEEDTVPKYVVVKDATEKLLDNSILGDGNLEQPLARGFDAEGMAQPDFGFLPTAPMGLLGMDAAPMANLNLALSEEEVRKKQGGNRKGNWKTERRTVRGRVRE